MGLIDVSFLKAKTNSYRTLIKTKTQMSNSKHIKRHRFNRVTVDDLYYAQEQEKANEKKRKVKKKPIAQDGDMTFNNKSFGALVRLRQEKYVGRIYRGKTNEVGMYALYFDGAPTPSMHVSYYDFDIINYF